jgi:hypothetical protein
VTTEIDGCSASCLWFSGRQITDLVLFDLGFGPIRVLWLGRLGKVIQFLSASIIVAEIIGHAVLRARMKGAMSPRIWKITGFVVPIAVSLFTNLWSDYVAAVWGGPGMAPFLTEFWPPF